MKCDVVVIGSGISGLTVAALLASCGKEVVIVEGSSLPGGAIKRFKRKGIDFDIGFHYTGCLDSQGILAKIWSLVGILPNLFIQSFPEGSAEEIRFFHSDKSAKLHFSYEETEHSLCQSFPAYSKQIKEYLQTIEEIANSVPFFNYNLPVESFIRGGWPYRRKPLKDFFCKLAIPKELVAVLCQPIFLYGVPLDQTSLGIHAIVAHSYLSGAYHINGGGQAIVNSFLERFNQLGVKVLTKEKVERIFHKNNKITGVDTQKQHIQAENVVYTGHPTHLLDLIDHEPFRPIYVSRLKELENTDSMFIVFGSLMPNTSVSDYFRWRNLYCISLNDAWVTDSSSNNSHESIMVTCPGLRDGGDHPKGGMLIRPASWNEASSFWAGPKQRKQGYKEWKEEQVDKLCKKIGQFWPNLHNSFKVVTASSPLTFADELSAPQGTVYGVKHSSAQIAPTVRTKVAGLFLSGQSTMMTGVVGASLSAITTVGEMIGFDQIWPKLIEAS